MQFFTVKDDFPLDGRGLPYDKKGAEAFMRTYLHIIFEEWIGFNKEKNKKVKQFLLQ